MILTVFLCSQRHGAGIQLIGLAVPPTNRHRKSKLALKNVSFHRLLLRSTVGSLNHAFDLRRFLIILKNGHENLIENPRVRSYFECRDQGQQKYQDMKLFSPVGSASYSANTRHRNQVRGWSSCAMQGRQDFFVTIWRKSQNWCKYLVSNHEPINSHQRARNCERARPHQVHLTLNTSMSQGHDNVGL